MPSTGDDTPAPPASPRAARLTAFAEVATVGLPFAFFKLAVGLHLVRLAAGWAWLGFALVGLAVVDLTLNALNGVGLAALGRRLGPICVLHGVVQRLVQPGAAFEEVGLALDAALAFMLVAGMIAGGALPGLPAPWLGAWNVAVVLNVLGAGVLRLAKALEHAALARRRTA